MYMYNIHEFAAVDYPDQEDLSQRLLQIHTYAPEPAYLFEMDLLSTTCDTFATIATARFN